MIKQSGTGTEPEPETGTVGTVFPETEIGTGTVGTVFQEPKLEPEPSFPVKLYWNTQKPFFTEEPPEPKTGTARTVPPPNRNRTEPNRGNPDQRGGRNAASFSRELILVMLFYSSLLPHPLVTLSPNGKTRKQKRHIIKNHIKFVKIPWMAGCPWDTRPVSRQKGPFLSVSL